MDHAIDDIEFLARSENRVTILAALRDGAATRRELQDCLEMDRVTLGRILGEFDERGWVAVGDECSITVLGRLVAEKFGEFRSFMGAVRELRPLVGVEPIEDPSFPAGRLTTATITTAGDGDPYAPVRRFMDLLRESDRLDGYDTTTIAPMYVEEIREEILGGMTTEVIYRPSVADQLVTDYREDVARTTASGHLELWVTEDLPCGLAIFDDRVAIGAYDESTGMLDVLVDTDDPAIREWAVESFSIHRGQAVPLTEWLEEPLS